nr:hypothetical protein [uncultured Carboxylicivirga sp.]
MKKVYLVSTFLMIAFASLFIISCDDDEKVWESSGNPTIEMVTAEVHTGQGRTMKIEAIVKDGVGIKSINLLKEDWFLDRTIEFVPDSMVKEYNLSYNFLVPVEAADDATNLVLTVENLGGDVTSTNVDIFMDEDYTNPVLSIASPIDGVTLQPVNPNMVDITCELSDDRALGYFVVKEEKLDIYDSISFVGTTQLSYSYTNSVDVGGDPETYTFHYAVADSAGNVVNRSTVVKVSSDFDKLYLSDVETEEQLTNDLFGVPMLIDKVAPYTFQAKYYSSAPGTEVKFLPQKANFTPHCYGIDPNNESKLINSPETALPIVLPEQGYYVIDLNLETMDYSFEKFTPTDDPYSASIYENEDDMNNYVGQLCVIGAGWTDFQNTTGWGWDGPDANRQMTVDPENPYIYTREEELEGNFQMIFGPYHPWGWWMNPYWRFDNASDPEKTVPQGGDNVNMDVPVKATYIITFDTYLNRCKVVLKN